MLWNLVMYAFVGGIAKAIIANHRASMECDPIPEQAMLMHDAIGEEDAVIANDSAWPDPDTGIEMAAATDCGSLLHSDKGVDIGAFADGSIWVNGCS